MQSGEKKRLFRNSISSYSLDYNYYLCFNKTKEEFKNALNSRRKNNRHIKKNKINQEYEQFIIPTVKNVINLIEKIHYSILHNGKNKMFKKIKELKIYYHGITRKYK